MLLLIDKIFLGFVLVCSAPALFFVAFILADFTVTSVFCVHAFYSVRMISSDCIFIKTLGYGLASAPILLFWHPDDHTLGGKVPTLDY